MQNKYIENDFKQFLDRFLKALNQATSEDTTITTKALLCIEAIKNLKKLKNKEKENIIDLLHNCYSENEKFDDTMSISVHANMYFLLGYLKSFLYAKIPLIDPVLKVALKKKYCLEEISDVETLKTNYELLNLLYSDSSKTLHSYCKLLSNKIVELQGKIEKYDKYVAVRPIDLSYKALFEVIIAKKIND